MAEAVTFLKDIINFEIRKLVLLFSICNRKIIKGILLDSAQTLTLFPEFERV